MSENDNLPVSQWRFSFLELEEAKAEAARNISANLYAVIKEKDPEITDLQIAHVKQESDNMVLRKYLKEVYDVLDRYQAFQLSGKTEGERAKETTGKEVNER